MIRTRPQKEIRVLVVDDSLVARNMLCEILSSDPELRVIGEARDGLEAVAKAIALKPDIVTMDIEMPVLNGLEAIERIMDQCPMPILAVTALSGVRTAFKAVSKGALDILEKSDLNPEDGGMLIKKIKILAQVDVTAHQIAMLRSPGVPVTDTAIKGVKLNNEPPTGSRIVAIAASTGGPLALRAILSRLPASFPIPMVIAQHVASGFTEGMTEWLNTCTELKVERASHGMVTRPGHVYINPAEFSMKISRDGFIRLFEGEQNQLYHPSCDTLLCSVAESFGKNSIGIILSGMGGDGVRGMSSIKSAGGETIAQDEHSSVVFGMNGLAIKKGAVEKVLPLDEIPGVLMRLAGLKNMGES